MYDQMNNSTIQCNVHQDSSDVLNEIKQKINNGASIGIKAKYAEELFEKASCLFDCEQYNDQKQDCNYCRLTAELNRKTAELIINAKRLSL